MNLKTNNTIALEELALVFASEFVAQNKNALEKTKDGRFKFLKMNAKSRLACIEKTLTALES